jgi:RND family efflux transporter MFP subunit
MAGLGRPASVLLLALVLAAACRRAPASEAVEREEAVVPVAVQAAARGTIRTAVHASGVVTPADGGELLVFAPEPARILEVTKAAGDMVAAGEILVRFEIPLAEQLVARARADVDRAQAQLENARTAQARVRDLVARGLVPRRDQETADRELADTQLGVERTGAALASAEATAARAVVRAPFAGLVAARLHNPGDVVPASATDPVLRVVDPRRLEVTASIKAEERSRILPGAAARLAGVVEGREVALRVLTPPSAAVSAGDMVTVRLSFEDAAAALPVDTSVEVDIDAGERSDVLFVPADALVRQGETVTLFVAIGDRAERRTVATGLAEGGRVEITSGLQPGELIVTRGHVGLADGARISADVR